MVYSAASIANAFLSRSFKIRPSTSPMKIQKLIYIAQGYSLALLGKAIVDELFEAWKFDPVLESLYHECKKYGCSSINHYLHDYGNTYIHSTPAPLPNDTDLNTIIDFVWKTYGSYASIELSNWTHDKGEPWDTVINNNGGAIYIEIKL